MGRKSERIALLYADGSISVYGPEFHSVDEACRNRRSDDGKETDPEKLTKVARINVDVIEIIDEPAAETCPTCGRTTAAAT